MKKGEIKRTRILDAAEKLFFERGCDRTSVQDILDALDLSKGGFYHYFDAKETVLREICERRWRSRFERVCTELSDTRRRPIERLNLLLRQADLFESEELSFAAMLMKLFYIDGDATIRTERRRVLMESLTNVAKQVVIAGAAEGTLHTRHPNEAGRLVLMLACDVNEEVCAMLAEESEGPDRLIRAIELLNAYRESVELLVGAPFGSVELFSPASLLASWEAASAELKRLEDKK